LKKYCKKCTNELLNSIRVCPACGGKEFSATKILEHDNPRQNSQSTAYNQFSNNSQTSNHTYSASNYTNSGTFLDAIFAFLGGSIVFIFFLVGIVQICAGYIGIEHSFGGGWATAAVIASLVFRFGLPLTIGTFICANDVWGWHWFWALAFTMPGILFMIPAFIATSLEAIRK